jgi:hypothetical protein
LPMPALLYTSTYTYTYPHTIGQNAVHLLRHPPAGAGKQSHKCLCKLGTCRPKSHEIQVTTRLVVVQGGKISHGAQDRTGLDWAGRVVGLGWAGTAQAQDTIPPWLVLRRGYGFRGICTRLKHMSTH